MAKSEDLAVANALERTMLEPKGCDQASTCLVSPQSLRCPSHHHFTHYIVGFQSSYMRSSTLPTIERTLDLQHIIIAYK